MSEGESFLARWSRLKRERAVAPSRDADADADAQAPEHAPPPADEPPVAIDLANLPPVESIGPGSDISAYLRVGVPSELTQAALRNAWRADPAVRDFVEIADNQWDFNTPEAIPGFGALGATEGAKSLIARAMGSAENIAATVTSLQPNPGSDRPDSQVMNGLSLEDSRVVDPVWQAGAVPLVDLEQTSVETPEARLAPNTADGADGTAGADATTGTDSPVPGRRPHGSALPK